MTKILLTMIAHIVHYCQAEVHKVIREEGLIENRQEKRKTHFHFFVQRNRIVFEGPNEPLSLSENDLR